MIKKFLLAALFSACILSVKSNSSIEIKSFSENGFPLSAANLNTTVYCDSTEQDVVKIAASLFCSDLEMVTGRKPRLIHSMDSLTENVVIIGTIDSCRFIKQLISSGKLHVDSITGGWERFSIQTLDDPFTGVKKALAIVGSDRRGAAFGVFELSKAIGVSPWYWWADVTPIKKESLYVSPLMYVSNEPTVKYRGIFINDEDWGLQEWSQVTYDPVKDIGPKTYEKVCELLLRLKANYLWPAMHPSTKPFNYYADNKVVADKYAILMGSSHHEPLLYNTYEWPYPTADWNPFTNMDKIMGELEKRVQSNGKYENIYTVGIRGTEDGGAAGGSTLNEKTAKLEEVITRQRELLTKHVDQDIRKVPQVFWPYKEVTDVYNNNMDLPDDITLGWVDDNYGYVRQVSNPTEQARSGGSGVYYHVSYWGVPSDYLWIASTPPALIASELKKAAAFGGNRVWIINVGDIKPAEMLMNYCMDLAWDYNKWGTDNVRDYLLEWSGYTFGNEFAEDITNAYTRYFQLAQAAKPEHVNMVKFPESEKEQRLVSYQELASLVESIYSRIPVELKDAFFETVYYPIKGAGLMNEKFFYASKSFKAAVSKDPNALTYSKKALAAHTAIKAQTVFYNTSIKNGKWNKIITSDIRDQSVYDMPAVATQSNVDKEYSPIASVNLSGGTFVAPMKYVNGVVFGDKAGKQNISTGGKAAFTFDLPKSIVADLYFYVRTPTVEEDSWYINLNGTAFVQNDFATGDDFEWVKVWNGTFKAGVNTLTINQREPNAQIAAIKIAEPGLLQYAVNYVPEPDTIVPAWKFAIKQNASGYNWEVIDGLTTSEKGVTNTPLTLPSVDLVKDAPYLEQELEFADSSFMLEVRCLPTRRLYAGRDLRIGISINDDEAKIFSIHKDYPTVAWEKNVLKGYVKTLLGGQSVNGKVKIRLYALDPGVVFDQILLYKDYQNNAVPTGIKSVHSDKKELKTSVFPNPCSDFLTVSVEKNDGETVELELTDLLGRSMLRKKVKPHMNDEKVLLPMSNLICGTYFLLIKRKDSVITKKIEKI